MNWEYAGFRLDTFAYNVEIISAGLGFPGRRGDNLEIPYRDGTRAVRKPLQERVIVMGMWVTGSTKAGLQENIDALLALFGCEGLQALERTMPDSSTRSIYCEAKNPIWFVNQTRHAARFTIDLHCPDPYWYGSTDTKFSIESLTKTSTAAILTNPGTGYSRKAEIKVTGETSNIKIANTTTTTWLQYNGDTQAGEVLTIDCDKYTAEVAGDTVIGGIKHGGDPAFLVIGPGDNSLIITCDTEPDAKVEIEFKTPYY